LDSSRGEASATILVVEDKRELRVQLRDALEHQGYEVLESGDGADALEQAVSGRPDLVILDLMLPGLDGIEVCRELRERGVDTPVIMLTARSEEDDRLTGFRSGADDYVTKPFSVRELMLRVRAMLRRAQGEAVPTELRIGDARVDFGKYTIFRGDQQFPLSEKEIALLRLLIANPHEVISRDRLLDEVWGYNAYPSTRTIDTFIYRLRQKIEVDPRDPQHLLTVWGTGYRFVP
jgi:two-component system alkaline phosphatase synthesis response regulator PhoP